MQGGQRRLLYSPSWEVRSSAAAILHEVNGLLSAGQPSWMDFADEGTGWEGAELIPQLSAEGNPAGTDRQPFLLTHARKAQEAPVPCQGTILPH